MMNRFALDDPVEAFALSRSQRGRSGVSAIRGANRAGRPAKYCAVSAPAGNPARGSSFIIRRILFNQRGSPSWS